MAFLESHLPTARRWLFAFVVVGISGLALLFWSAPRRNILGSAVGVFAWFAISAAGVHWVYLRETTAAFRAWQRDPNGDQAEDNLRYWTDRWRFGTGPLMPRART